MFFPIDVIFLSEIGPTQWLLVSNIDTAGLVL